MKMGVRMVRVLRSAITRGSVTPLKELAAGVAGPRFSWSKASTAWPFHPVAMRFYGNGADGDLHRFRVVTFPVDASTRACTPAKRPQKLTSKEYQNTSK